MNAKPPRDYDAAAMAIRDLLAYVCEPVAGVRVHPKHLKVVRNRAIAVAWALNPDILGGQSLRQLSWRIGMSRNKLSIYTAQVRRRFGLRNRFHAHDWRNH